MNAKSKLKWECSKKHTWLAPQSNIKQGNWCPYCSGRLATSEDNLSVVFPQLAKEYHTSKNATPADAIKPNSGKKVWWKCRYAHEWEAPVDRRSRGSGCPYCAGKKASKTNNLETIFPSIAAEWHPTKNKIFPSEVTPRSNKKVWWRCSKGHDYKGSINNRTRSSSLGCPICSRSVASISYNLKTEKPKIAAEWHPTKNKLQAHEYLPSSNKRVWWKCNLGHEWTGVIASRTKDSTCPYCSGVYPTKEYNFAKLHPIIAREWHPTKNSFFPHEVTPRSDRKAWWICSKGHEWEAVIGSRAVGVGCPKCTTQTSKNELRILTELRAIFVEVESRKKLFGVEVDIFLPILKIAIEYDGIYWHRNKEDKDKEKQVILNKNEIGLIRVREEPLPKLSINDIIVPQATDIAKTDIELILKVVSDDKTILKNYAEKQNFVNEPLYRIYLNNFPSPLPEHSLAKSNPRLSKEWHIEKNSPLTPLNFTSNATYNAWWKCKYGHEWQRSIHQRNGKKTGCPYCSGRRALPSNNIAVTHPNLMQLWHPSRNVDLKSEKIKAGSQKKIWWRCLKGHEFQATVNNMSRPSKTMGCPYCGGKKVCDDNSLAQLNPELAKDWHPTLNTNTPNDVTEKSGKRAWWRCQLNSEHVWEAVIGSRATGAGCPYCAGNRLR